MIASAIAFTYLHEYQPASSKEYKEVKSRYKKIIKNRDTGFSTILTELELGVISRKEYIAKYKSIRLNSEIELSDYHSCKNEVKEADSVLGYTSYKNYLLGISFPVFGMFTTLILLYIVVKNVDERSQRIFYLILTFSFIAAWGYWLAWSNLNHTQDPKRPGDFPRFYYNICLYVLPTISFFLFYYLFKKYKTIEEKVSNIINMFYTALYKNIPDKKFIDPEKEDEYRLFRLELTKNAVENE